MKATLHFIVLIVLANTAFCQQPNHDYSNIHIPADAIVNVALGIPKDNTLNDDYIVSHHQYVLSYNKDRNEPNWVSWNLGKKWYGTFTRSKVTFKPDGELPEAFRAINHKDYSNKAHFDRGHLCPSDERTHTLKDNLATFLTSNIVPQKSDLNQGVWRDMERWCNAKCKSENAELYIIAGGIYSSDNRLKNVVAIPDSCYKIVVILKKGQGLSSVTKDTKIEAVIMPNKMGIRRDKWQKYKTTVRHIEASTGYDFLTAVPKSVQDVIENNAE